MFLNKLTQINEVNILLWCAVCHVAYTCVEWNATLPVEPPAAYTSIGTVGSIMSVWLHRSEWLSQDKFAWNYIFETFTKICGQDILVGIATRYGLDGPGSNPGRGEIFRACPDQPWGPPSLLYNGYRVFPGGKVRPWRVIDRPPPSSAKVKERVELYLYLHLLPLWAFMVYSWVHFTLPLLKFVYICKFWIKMRQK